MKGCPFLVEDCTMDGTDYDCEHPTYGVKYGCDHCPMFGRNGDKRQYRLVNPRVTPPNTASTRLETGAANADSESNPAASSGLRKPLDPFLENWRMNKDEIPNMPAGYEINKLIAINVMGWALVNNHGAAGGKFWIGHGGSFGDMPESYLPDFSGEIAPAFSVVEKLCNENGCDIVKVCKRDPELLRGEWSCNFGLGFEAFGETAPLAICRSALLARGLTPLAPDTATPSDNEAALRK